MRGATTGFEAQRLHMVERQLVRRGIRDSRVLDAMRAIPRESFVPESARHRSYQDEPISIGHGQTISQPYIIALMAECLILSGSEKVLEVGTGCGYHAAVLAKLAQEVVTVEIVPELAGMARQNLEDAGLSSKVRIVCADGSLGYPESAPYDAISVAAAAPASPAALLDQLSDLGRMVIPIGSLEEQELRVISKHHGDVTSRTATHCRFVPLRGGEGWNLS